MLTHSNQLQAVQWIQSWAPPLPNLMYQRWKWFSIDVSHRLERTTWMLLLLTDSKSNSSISIFPIAVECRQFCSMKIQTHSMGLWLASSNARSPILPDEVSKERAQNYLHRAPFDRLDEYTPVECNTNIERKTIGHEKPIPNNYAKWVKSAWTVCLPSGHRVDQIEQSNRQPECLIHAQQHQYKAVCPIQRYKIERMSWYVWFAFVFPAMQMG